MNQHSPQDAVTLLASHEKRIALIRQYANELVPADFEQKWLSVLRSCAQWFSTMPLHPDMHCEPGGAFRATVDVVYFAMRLSGGQKFAADKPSERRRELEPQYLYALFLAACCTWLDEPCRHFVFAREDTGEHWIPAAHGDFQSWVDGKPYRVIRLEHELAVERMRSAMLARSILGAEALARLESGVLTEMFGAINPLPMPSGTEALLHKIVRQAVAATRDYEQKARRAVFQPDSSPTPTVDQLQAAGMAGAVSPKAPKSEPAVVPVPPAPSAAAGAAALFTAAAASKLPEASAPATDGQVDGPVGSSAPAVEPLPSSGAIQVVDLAAVGSIRRESEDPFLKLVGTSPMMREFFRALAQDVTSGKVTVAWNAKGLVLPKKILGNYGITPDTLVSHLRKQSLLYEAQGSEIVLHERIGVFVLPRSGEDQ